MKRTNEFAVGLAVLLALALVVAGALWLSETDVNQRQVNAHARFRITVEDETRGPVIDGVQQVRVAASYVEPVRTLASPVLSIGMLWKA